MRIAGEAIASVTCEARYQRVRSPLGTFFLAQRFARHVSPLTTTVYAHPIDQEM